MEGLVGSAIGQCLKKPGARLFAVSIAFNKGGAITKPYFDGSDVLSGAERGCIRKAIKGLAPAGAPGGTVVAYRIHVDAGGALAMTPFKH